MSLLQRQDGSFYQMYGPTDEEVVAAAAAFFGGYEYTITDAQAAELSAAGYGAWLTKVGA